MAFTNSSLVSYTRISPNKTSPRNQPITKITIHHMAGVASVETFGNIVANSARQMSANYAIGNDGRIGLFCEEKDRSWCSSSAWNDNRAITIEVSNSATTSDWPISDAAYNSLIKLCVDICKRNGIPKLEFTGTKDGSLTFHYQFSSTSCVDPNITELLTPDGWVYLKDISVGDAVAAAHIDNLNLTFEPVLYKVPEYTHDTWKVRDIETTADHRILAYNQNGHQHVYQMQDFIHDGTSVYIPNAGYMNNTQGLGNLSKSDIEFLVAVQADGCYMKDGNCLYGIEFHLKKDRKIKRLKELFSRFGIEYKEIHQSDGTTKLRLYGKKYVKKCEEYLNNKTFTWEWLQLSPQQATWMLECILEYDGCKANNSYSSCDKINVDVVQAIASIHGVGTKLYVEHRGKKNRKTSYRVYFKKPMRSRGAEPAKRRRRRTVSCVTVPTGFILVRQHGRTTIIGNCPGPWIKSHTAEICNKVNAQLNENKGSTTTSSNTQTSTSSTTANTTTTSYTVSLKASDLVYASAGGNQTGTVGATGVFTIVEEKTVNNVKYGRLKSGIGWVKVPTTSSTSTNTTTPATAYKVGDLVKIASNATYYTGGSIPAWVKAENWYISSISGSRAVLGLNEAKNRNIQSPINTKFLTKTTAGSTIKVGDSVKVTKNVTYDGKTFVLYVSTYKVLQLNGDRAVISADGKNVTAAVNIANLKKV